MLRFFIVLNVVQLSNFLLQDLEKLKVFIKKYKSQKLLMNQDLSF